MSDGKIEIKVILSDEDALKGIKDLQKSFNDLGSISSVFSKLGTATGVFGKTFNALSSVMSTTTAKITAGIGLIVIAYNKLYEASKQNFSENLERFGTVFQKIGSIVSSVVNEIVTCFSQVTGIDLGFASLIAGAIEFESSMARVSAIMGVTGQGIETLTNSARQYGATTRYTATEVAEAYKYMGMAGFSMQESLSSIQQVLDLTTIGATQLGVASDIVTDGLTALGMSANQAGDFVDYMSATITRSNTDVEMMGETLKYAGSVAGTLGVSMDDLSVAIGLMANSSVKASRAGTSLRGLLANLSAPSDSVAGAMEKYGISLITAKDGSVDLDATLRNLRESLKGLPLTEQAAACKNLAGKTGMTGLMAIVNATDEAYDSLTNSVQNSTETVSYWNENLGQAGVYGKEASDRIENLKTVLGETEYIGSAFNATAQDMALALQLLGADAKVTAEDVEGLFNVFSVMREPSKAQTKVMKELGLTYREIGDDAFDYSKTCDAIRSNNTGLTEDLQEQVIAQLDANMSLEEANKVLKKYGQYKLEAFSTSTGQIDLVSNLKELRDTFGGMSNEARKASLEQLGLGDSINEVNEICNMSKSEFDRYCKNLELVTGLSRKMAEAMDETTKGSLLELASALEDVGIEAFERMKNGIQSTSKSLTDFFNIWRSGNTSGEIKDGQSLYTFDNFKKALDNLLNDIKNADIAGAIGQAINGAVTFITGGGLSGILSIGGEIVHQLCQGIIKNSDKINEGVSSTIKQIAGWIEDHASEVGEAGKVIIDALRTGIEDNTDGIHRAMEAVAGAMNEWVDGSEQIKALTGNFADIFIDSLIENTASKVGGKATEWWNSVTSTLMHGQPDMTKGGTGFLASVLEWFFPSESSAGEKTGNEKPLQGGGKKKDKTTTNLSDKLTGMNTKELEAFRTELAALQNTANEVASSVSSSFTSIQSSIRESMTGCANIVRNQMLSVTNVVRNQALNSANIIRNQFVNISNIIRSQSLNSSNIVRNQFVSMSNVIRTQMVNCSNIVRNQMVSISNVVRNQSKNARNAFTTQFISLGKVARTQITQARNVVTSQMISMSNVIRTQANNARNAFTSAMISIKNVARVQSSEAGRYIATGLAVGIRSGTASAVSAARSMVNQVNAIVRSAAKIASPSKVTTEYGEFYGQGFGVGIKKAMPNVYRVALDGINGLNDKIKSTVNAEMSKIYVSANASSTNNIKNQTTAIATLSDDDIEKLGDALSSRPNVVKTSINEKEIIEVVAEPVRKHIAKNNERNKRKKGG